LCGRGCYLHSKDFKQVIFVVKNETRVGLRLDGLTSSPNFNKRQRQTAEDCTEWVVLEEIHPAMEKKLWKVR